MATTEPRTDTVSIEGSPAARAVMLVESGLFDTYVLYEREGVWTVAGGVRGSVTLDASRIRTTWCGEERSRPWRARPLDAIGAALASLPIADWNAYGWITFETALLASQGDVPARDHDLAHLIVPEIEVRISADSASITCTDDNLRKAVHKALLGDVPDDDNCPSVAVDLSEGGQRYRDAVAEAVREIRRGAFRKVILSRKVPLPEPVDLARTYLRGRAANTPARSFLLSAGGMAAAGFCPETILESDTEGFISTQPLAGTRAFGTEALQNRQLRAELLSDAKELVEHVLSVQLAFEELEGVCSPGSVAVSELLSVKERGSVQHLASRVCGRLRRGLSAWDALEAVFPAVTASGIPKAPSSNFITRSEPDRRGLYSGAVLTASSDGSLDAGLILRTLFEEGGRQWLHAGAGIIAESRPDREYEETCEKLRSVAPYLVPRAPQGVPLPLDH
ncbi:salicylate synthase [Lentzea flava]|uniref:salicylate synthase n=1 Tax=Lentzea flava TaxID=103732 RepID=UPI001E56333B|nr:salicylate synthase [Lentzea flava]